MDHPQETRERIDSLDLDVEKVLFNDSPETLYFHGIMEEKIRNNRNNRNNRKNDESTPRRLFYNADLLNEESPTGTIPILVPAETPKKKLNWRRASSPRKVRSSGKYSGKSLFFKIFFVTIVAAACLIATKCEEKTRLRLLTLATGMVQATAPRFNALASPFQVPQADTSTKVTVTELPPVCSNPMKKLFNAECRLHVGKIRLERKELKEKRL
jgi:hypothetical protein